MKKLTKKRLLQWMAFWAVLEKVQKPPPGNLEEQLRAYKQIRKIIQKKEIK